MLKLNIERGHTVMVFKSILASLGMGAASIDLILITDGSNCDGTTGRWENCDDGWRCGTENRRLVC